MKLYKLKRRAYMYTRMYIILLYINVCNIKSKHFYFNASLRADKIY